MKIVRHSDIEWVKDDIHDMYSGFHDDLPINESADIMFAKIEPGHTLPLHWHTRPLDFNGLPSGYESFFFFQGGRIILLRRNDSIEYDFDEPFTITFVSGEDDMHGIKNIGNKSVMFQVLCAPKFDDGEEHFVKNGE